MAKLRKTRTSSFAQRPLQSPRGRNPHDFTQALPDWEASVFDNAVQFVAMYFRRPIAERRFEFATFREAVDHANAQCDPCCVYAVAASGRFAMLDRAKWDEWFARQSEGKAA